MPVDTIQWTFRYENTPVKTTPVMVSNTMIRQIRNGVYYIPQSAYGKVFIADMLGRTVPICASERFADHMILDLNKYAAKGKYVLVYGNKD
jgi:hypothetical protein